MPTPSRSATSRSLQGQVGILERPSNASAWLETAVTSNYNAWSERFSQSCLQLGPVDGDPMDPCIGLRRSANKGDL